MPLEQTDEIGRQELIDLHTHYESVVKDELDLFFKYFNFYIGLLSAMIAATLAGFFSLKESLHGNIKYVLTLGPFLIISLSILGYYFIRVYYRRFLEAIVTLINIKSMLRYTEKAELAKNIKTPIMFPSKFGGGFITQFNRKATRAILEEGSKNNWPAEDVLDKLLKKGDTLRYAKLTLMLYGATAIALMGFIIFCKNYGRDACPHASPS